MRLRTIEEIKAYFEGQRKGIKAFAWWKDGLQYVGTTGTPLIVVLTEIYHLENDTCTALAEGGEIWT